MNIKYEPGNGPRKTSGSVYTCEFDDKAIYVGCCPTCRLHGDRCTCTAEMMLTLHQQMPQVRQPNELRIRLRAGQGYRLEVVSKPINDPIRLYKASTAHIEKLSSESRAIISRPSEEVRTTKISDSHRQSLRDAWARRKRDKAKPQRQPRVTGDDPIVLHKQNRHWTGSHQDRRTRARTAVESIVAELPEGTRLPACKVIAQKAGVSPTAVHNAYVALTLEGVLSCDGGKYTVKKGKQ